MVNSVNSSFRTLLHRWASQRGSGSGPLLPFAGVSVDALLLLKAIVQRSGEPPRLTAITVFQHYGHRLLLAFQRLAEGFAPSSCSKTEESVIETRWDEMRQKA
mgnify:CR=1 FL=1